MVRTALPLAFVINNSAQGVISMAHEPSTMLEPADIKSRVDILDIVRRYVSLKKHGKIYQGLCPFHVEKTPSFTVFQESQSFHCFGCGAGHDVFDFIQQIENLRFPDALKKLQPRLL